MKNEDLEALIKKAREHVMSDEEKDAQAESFAYGNVRLSGSDVSREDISQAAQNLKNSADKDQQLTAANQRIKEMEGQIKTLVRESNSYQRAAVQMMERAEAAERKLATYERIYAVLYSACQVSHTLLDSKSRNADRIEERLRKALEFADDALVQIEQVIPAYLEARDAEIRQKVMREMASKGGVKGAATLNARLTPEERKASASKAAKSRWAYRAGGKQ